LPCAGFYGVGSVFIQPAHGSATVAPLPGIAVHANLAPHSAGGRRQPPSSRKNTMERFPEFISNHSSLALAFVVILGSLLWTLWQSFGRGMKKLSPMDATHLINREDAVVLDVRSDGEFNQGHIVNAVNIPQKSVQEQLSKLEKYRNRPIITACRTGQIALGVSSTLRKNGFEQVYNLAGGLIAWEGANLPLVKK
jgi:rhodanese-related sulfurtransferase